jgi:DUF4097 and DUF4098 domain-containing protein YvlB
MNEERTMILNMLKDGKINVEEANSLLEALGDNETGAQENRTRDDLKFDLDGMKEGLKSGMKDFAKTMEGTIKSAVENIKSFDFGGAMSNAFGAAKETSEKEIILSSDGIRGVDIKTGSGDVTAAGGEGQDILIHAFVTCRGSDAQSAKQRADEIEILQSLENGILSIKDSGSGKQITGPYSVDYKITLPRGTDMNIKTMDGDVHMSALDGNLKVKNYSGDIVCEDNTGTLNINTKSGDLTTEGFSGSVEARTLSGDITLKSINSDDVVCHALSGDIEGEINTGENPKIEIRTLSGDVDLKVPASSNFAISAETLNGDISCGLPVEDVEEKAHCFSARLNKGDGKLSLSTKSGDISISELES